MDAETRAAIEADQVYEINRLRVEAGSAITDAVKRTLAAKVRVERLRSDRVFDVEFEGLPGAAIERLLTQALDNLVAVQALLPKD